MAKRATQTAFDERLVEDEAFEESCEALESYHAEIRAARKELLEEPTERFRQREEELAAKWDLPVHSARVDGRLSEWAATYDAGTRVRVGVWAVPIKEYTTIEKVEGGKGKKAGKPTRVNEE